jgi:Leucine-rich repeat (LRR) protein
MTFLNTLDLSNNFLSDLGLTLEVLGRLGHLDHLDLSGNPIAEEKVTSSPHPPCSVRRTLRTTRPTVTMACATKQSCA